MIDHDKLLSLDETIEAYGLTRGTWLEAIASKDVEAAWQPGRVGYRIRGGSARAFARRWLELHPVPHKEGEK